MFSRELIVYQMGWTGQCVRFSRSGLTVAKDCGRIAFHRHGDNPGHSRFFHHLRLSGRLIKDGIEGERFSRQRLVETRLRAR